MTPKLPMQEPKHESSESLLARGIAPIKATYMSKSGQIQSDPNRTAPLESNQNGQNGSHQASKVAPERKSRRAYKKVST